MRYASLLLAALAVVPSAAYATTFTDGFGTAVVNTDVTAAGNFTAIDGTNVDVLGASDGFEGLCVGVTVCVDLGGSGGNPFGNIVSNVSFSGTNEVSFSLTGSDRGDTTTTEVLLGSTVIGTYTLASNGVENFSGMVTGSGPLEFILLDTPNGDIGSILNSVSVTSVSATPEPSSLVLLGSGLLSGAGALMRRRRK
jgi:PEP-CTERM motif